MADQGKWFKLWTSVLDDPELNDLSHEDWARWVRLGVFLKKHGSAGTLLIKSPSNSLQAILWVSSFEAILRVIPTLPGYALEGSKGAHEGLKRGSKGAHEEGKISPLHVTANVTIETVTYKIRCLNWHKYQGDFSVDRVRKHRSKQPLHVTANVTAQEEKRREEKRRDKEDKKKYLDFVWLTATEHQKLTAALGSLVPEYIERLNGHIGQIGETKASKKYDSHYHTILNWVRGDRDKAAVKHKDGARGGGAAGPADGGIPLWMRA